MSNWQKLKGKLTAQGVIKPKAASSENDQVVNVDGKRTQKQMQRETNVATIKAQHLKHFVKSKYIGLDCEMVGLGMNGKESALARCCCVDFDGSILYDKFVRPKGFVTDFRTEWSGVRKKDLRQGQAIEFSQVLIIIKRDYILTFASVPRRSGWVIEGTHFSWACSKERFRCIDAESSETNDQGHCKI